MDKVRGLKQLFIYCLFGVSMSSTLPVCAQQVRLDNLKEQFSKKNLFRINGGLAANGVFTRVIIPVVSLLCGSFPGMSISVFTIR